MLQRSIVFATVIGLSLMGFQVFAAPKPKTEGFYKKPFGSAQKEKAKMKKEGFYKKAGSTQKKK